MQTWVAPLKSEDIKSLEYGSDFFTRNWICQNWKETSQLASGLASLKYLQYWACPFCVHLILELQHYCPHRHITGVIRAMIKNRNLRKGEGEFFLPANAILCFHHYQMNLHYQNLSYMSYKMMKPELPAAKTWQQEFTQALKSNKGQFTLYFPGKITKIHHIYILSRLTYFTARQNLCKYISLFTVFC